MKKIYVLFVLISCNLHSQCDWNSIFPFKMGSSRFDITIINNNNKNIGYHETSAHISGLTSFDYLEKKVYINSINLKYLNKCFSESDSYIRLTLSDDSLYKVTIKLDYIDYDLMMIQYNKIKKLVSEIYRYYKNFTTTNYQDEKIGEGFLFYKKKEVDKSDKLNTINVGYEISYKRTNLYEPTNIVDKYIIQIDFVDLRKSKLTKKRY